MESGNALAMLASDVRVIAEKELNVYSPVLCVWYPESAMVAAKLLHRLYGERLVSFHSNMFLNSVYRAYLPSVNSILF